MKDYKAEMKEAEERMVRALRQFGADCASEGGIVKKIKEMPIIPHTEGASE